MTPTHPPAHASHLLATPARASAGLGPGARARLGSGWAWAWAWTAGWRTGLALAALVPVLATLAACGSGPVRHPAAGAAPAKAASTTASRWPERDGAEAQVPPGLMAMPDAEPRLEPVRAGGPNKPYAVLGRSYLPLLGDPPMVERGLASWYGRKFHGRPTSTGELYDMYAMTAAHPTMPLPSYARVRNPANGQEVVLRVNDRGPFHSDRIIDLSYTAALKLGLLKGVAVVEVERITQEAIKSASWRRPGASDLVLASGAGVAVPASVRPASVLPASPPPAAAAAAPPAAGAALRPEAEAPSGYWVQLGAFSLADGALTFRQQVAQRLDWLAPLLNVFSGARVHRLQAGPYASRDEALAVAERLRQDLKLLPTLVERR